MSKHSLYRLLSWIVTLLVPVALVLTSLRLLLFPAFLSFEYNMPNFPQDRYGFKLEDRLYWAPIAVEYLLNDAGIEFLADLRFDNGTAVYNERELRHMVDVKAAVEAALAAWYIALVGLFLLGLWAWLGGWLDAYCGGLARGGWLTAILLAAAMLFVLVSFGVFFVAFHNVFFEAGTWMFNYSDTLIRLFPERFWRDIFIYVGLISGGAGLILGFAFRPRKA